MQVLAVYFVIAAAATCAMLAWAAQGADLQASRYSRPALALTAPGGPLNVVQRPVCVRTVGLEAVAAAFQPVYCANSKRWRDPVTKRYVKGII